MQYLKSNNNEHVQMRLVSVNYADTDGLWSECVAQWERHIQQPSLTTATTGVPYVQPLVRLFSIQHLLQKSDLRPPPPSPPTRHQCRHNPTPTSSTGIAQQIAQTDCMSKLLWGTRGISSADRSAFIEAIIDWFITVDHNQNNPAAAMIV